MNAEESVEVVHVKPAERQKTCSHELSQILILRGKFAEVVNESSYIDYGHSRDYSHRPEVYLHLVHGEMIDYDGNDKRKEHRGKESHSTKSGHVCRMKFPIVHPVVDVVSTTIVKDARRDDEAQSCAEKEG